MKIITADFIYIDGDFVKNKAIAFEDTIVSIDTLDKLKETYPNAEVIVSEENSVIYPGFINTHVHLEFSANKTALKYGSFMPWLDTVIEHRDELVSNCTNEVMSDACSTMLRSGISTLALFLVLVMR